MKIDVFFDNAGGVTVQSGDWAGYWHDGPDAAETIAALLNGESHETWENDEEAAKLDVDIPALQSGGYLFVTLGSWKDIECLDKESSWFNERELARRLNILKHEYENGLRITNNKPYFTIPDQPWGSGWS